MRRVIFVVATMLLPAVATYVRRLNPNPVRQDEAPICDERDIDLLADPYNRG